MAVSLSESAIASIAKSIDDVTSDPHKIPGAVLIVVGKDGKPIFAHASGKRGIDTEEPMTLDTTFWIASCTKMIGAIAAMQLVEQGKLALDDADMVEKMLPELRDVKILKSISADGKPELVEKKNRITLRMLLTHTGKFNQDMSFMPPLIECQSWIWVLSGTLIQLPSSRLNTLYIGIPFSITTFVSGDSP